MGRKKKPTKRHSETAWAVKLHGNTSLPYFASDGQTIVQTFQHEHEATACRNEIVKNWIRNPNIKYRIPHAAKVVRVRITELPKARKR